MRHEVLDTILAIAVPAITLAGSITGLMIRNAILASRVIIGEQIGVVGKKIDVHVAEDAIMHRDLERRITRIEGI